MKVINRQTVVRDNFPRHLESTLGELPAMFLGSGALSHLSFAFRDG